MDAATCSEPQTFLGWFVYLRPRDCRIQIRRDESNRLTQITVMRGDYGCDVAFPDLVLELRGHRPRRFAEEVWDTATRMLDCPFKDADAL